MTLQAARPGLYIETVLVWLLVVAAASAQTPASPTVDPDACEPMVIPSPAQADYVKACPNGATTAACDRWWHLRQSGIFKAREMLAAKLSTPGAPVDRCHAGQGVIVAQMDTGVMDAHSWDGVKAPLDRASMHAMLQGSNKGAYTILTRTADDATALPLSYSKGPASASACQPGPLAKRGETCAARDPKAEDVPRDADSAGDVIPGLTQSGHATGTMHVLLQAAPAISVVPYKFAGGIVVTPGRSIQLASAVVSAAAEDRLAGGTGGRIDVMTMSLGRRSPDQDLEHALLVAEEQGIILVAAAGQWPLHAGTRTRYPARYPSVIGVAGTHSNLVPWNKVGRGKNVVAAPAVKIWRAGWNAKTASYKQGNGTSFAAPQVAATAAMWIQYHGGRQALDHRYGRAAVGSAFRYVLETEGWRSPAAVCADLLAGNPAWTAICAQTRPTWDVDKWGVGILAADKVLAATLPTRATVCAHVMSTRGPLAYAAICPEPLRATARGYNAEDLTKRPSVGKTTPITYVSGATLIGNGDSRPGWFEPAVSFGFIMSGYELNSPGGLFLQGTVNRRTQELSIGAAGLVEYAANGPGGKLDVFPVFGPTIGAALTVTGIREDTDGSDKWWVGPKAQLTYYRVRLQFGWVWGIAGTKGNRGLFTLGVGF